MQLSGWKIFDLTSFDFFFLMWVKRSAGWGFPRFFICSILKSPRAGCRNQKCTIGLRQRKQTGNNLFKTPDFLLIRSLVRAVSAPLIKKISWTRKKWKKREINDACMKWAIVENKELLSLSMVNRNASSSCSFVEAFKQIAPRLSVMANKQNGHGNCSPLNLMPFKSMRMKWLMICGWK